MSGFSTVPSALWGNHGSVFPHLARLSFLKTLHVLFLDTVLVHSQKLHNFDKAVIQIWPGSILSGFCCTTDNEEPNITSRNDTEEAPCQLFFTLLYIFPRVKLHKAIIVYLMTFMPWWSFLSPCVSFHLLLTCFILSSYVSVSSVCLFFCFPGGYVLLWNGLVWAVVWPSPIAGSSPAANSEETLQGHPACPGNSRGSAVLLPAGFDARMLGYQTRESIKWLFKFKFIQCILLSLRAFQNSFL